MKICDSSKCTGCGACVSICPKKCISFRPDSMDRMVALADETVCVNCGLCKKTCPQNCKSEANMPLRCYAAWSMKTNIRARSASGGVAAELYKDAVEHGVSIVGVVLDKDMSCHFEISKDATIIEQFQNSKYVFSKMGMIYQVIEEELKRNLEVVFVGLPCQVAGLKSFLGTRGIQKDTLYTADLVCHGSAPERYLSDHIKWIEKRKHKTVDAVCFRDPDYGTHNFCFTAKNGASEIYHRKVYRDDTYQVGYHSGIIYRENCYQCQYACVERQGDITLADFSGVGSKQPCCYSNINVSCVLANTEKGEEWVQRLSKTKKIYIEERPIEEELDTEKQLHAPTAVTAERRKFIEKYSEKRDFEKAMKYAAGFRMTRNEIRYYSHVDDIKALLRRMISPGAKSILKKALKRN